MVEEPTGGTKEERGVRGERRGSGFSREWAGWIFTFYYKPNAKPSNLGIIGPTISERLIKHT